MKTYEAMIEIHPEEVIRHDQAIPFYQFDYDTVGKLIEAYRKKNPELFESGTRVFEDLCLGVFLFEAGRCAGIRQERQRRRK